MTAPPTVLRDDQASLVELDEVYELRIGAVGHRKLERQTELAAAVRRLLERIERTLTAGRATPLRWTVVSPLAKGADRIIARVACDARHARLEVITPFPVEEYRRDFVAAEDAAEFDELTVRCHELTVLSTPTWPLGKASTIPETITAEQRRLGYLQVGQAVVDAVEILVAIWDGQPAAGVGGTADVIAYALTRARLVIRLDPNDPDAEPTLVQRAKGQESGWRFAALPHTAEALSAAYAELDDYRQDNAVAHSEIHQHEEAEKHRLREIAIRHGLGDASLNRAFHWVLPYFSRADSLANHYHRRYALAGAGLFGLSAFAVTAATAQRLFLEQFPLWGTVELAALLVALLWLAQSRRQGWHHKWLQSRYIAEHLRTAIFTVLRPQDSEPTVMNASSLRFYSGPRRWLSEFCSRVIQNARHQPAPLELQERIQDFIRDAWIEDQLHWHQANARRRAVFDRRARATGFVLFAMTLGLGCVHLLDGIAREAIKQVCVDTWISFFAVVLPAWGAAVHAINNQLESSRVVARSRGMVEELSEAREKLRSAHTTAARWQVILDTEKLVHQEQYEWWVLLSFRDATVGLTSG